MSRKRNGQRINGGPGVPLAHLRLIKDHFLFNVESGAFYRVNESAAFVVSALQGRTPYAEMVKDYAQRFAITSAVAERDLELFLNSLGL